MSRSHLLLPLSLLSLSTCVQPGQPDEQPDSCFSGGTWIDTPNGRKRIESLKAGASILAYDHLKSQVVVSRVVRTWVHAAALVVKHASGVIAESTLNHPFFDAALNNYRALEKLEVTSAFLRIEGRQVRGSELSESEWQLRETDAVFNLEVEGVHNYFADGALVHNKSGPLEDNCFFDALQGEADSIVCEELFKPQSKLDQNSLGGGNSQTPFPQAGAGGLSGLGGETHGEGRADDE